MEKLRSDALLSRTGNEVKGDTERVRTEVRATPSVLDCRSRIVDLPTYNTAALIEESRHRTTKKGGAHGPDQARSGDAD